MFVGGGSRRSGVGSCLDGWAVAGAGVRAGVEGVGCASEEPFAASKNNHFPKVASNHDVNKGRWKI